MNDLQLMKIWIQNVFQVTPRYTESCSQNLQMQCSNLFNIAENQQVPQNTLNIYITNKKRNVQQTINQCQSTHGTQFCNNCSCMKKYLDDLQNNNVNHLEIYRENLKNLIIAMVDYRDIQRIFTKIVNQSWITRQAIYQQCNIPQYHNGQQTHQMTNMNMYNCAYQSAYQDAYYHAQQQNQYIMQQYIADSNEQIRNMSKNIFNQWYQVSAPNPWITDMNIMMTGHQLMLDDVSNDDVGVFDAYKRDYAINVLTKIINVYTDMMGRSEISIELITAAMYEYLDNEIWDCMNGYDFIQLYDDVLSQLLEDVYE